jgi:hypothetical protein
MKKFNIAFFVLFFITINMQAQNDSLVKIRGNITVNYDYYSYDVENYTSFRPHYPANSFQLIANATIQVGKHLSIPFGINVNNKNTTYNIPQLPEEGLIDYVQNPKNNIHIDPKYKWLQGYIGSHTPNYSPLSTGDIQVFGVGFDINPKKIIASASYGKSQIAIAPDALLNIQGAYKQKLFGARVGYGKLKGNQVVINFVKIKDDVNSLSSHPIGIDPKEGITVSPYITYNITKALKLTTETAVSIFTDDLLDSSLFFNADNFSSYDNFIKINASSTIDYSHSTSLEYKTKKWRLGATVKYVGPDFTPAGYRSVSKDIMDYKINTAFKMLKNKVSIKGTLGIRKNNVKNTSLESTNRIISNMTIYTKVNKAFSFTINYTNFGFRNNVLDNTLRVEMVNNAISLAPVYQIKAKTKQHQINANLSYNTFKQFDVASVDFVNTTATSYMLNYMLLFKNLPLNIGASTMYLNNTSPIMDFSLANFGVSAGYRFMNKKLNTALALNYASITRGSFTPDIKVYAKLKLKYKLDKKTQFKINYSFKNTAYGTSKPAALLDENRIQFAINKRF